MVKINLLDTPEDEPSFRKQKSETPPVETPKSEMDFSFLQPEETTPPPEPQIAPAEPATFPRQSTEEDVLFAPPGTTDEKTEDTFTYESGSKKKLFIILGVIVVLLLVALFVILWMGPEPESPSTVTPPVKSGGPPGAGQPGTSPTAQTSQNRVSPMLQRVYAQNNGENQFYLNYATNLLGISTARAGLSMVVIAPGAIYVSVLADSRDDIARFRQAAKDKLPGMQLQIQNISPRIVQDQQKLMADFFIPLSGSATPKPPGNTVEPLSEGAVLSTLRAQAHSTRLRVVRLKQGQKHRTGVLNIIPCYMTVSGSKSAIIKFLTELTRKYPAIQLTKVSIFPSGTGVIHQGNVKARIEMNVTTPTDN